MDFFFAVSPIIKCTIDIIEISEYLGFQIKIKKICKVSIWIFNYFP